MSNKSKKQDWKSEMNQQSDGYQAYVSNEADPKEAEAKAAKEASQAEAASQAKDAEAPKEEKRLLTPEVLSGKYNYIREIGHGTQGHVYHAKRISDGMDVAIKVLNIDSVTNWKDYELFQREVAVLSSLDMDGVAKFYEAIEDLTSARPAAYLVQEYINGRSVSDMLASGYRISINRIYDLIIQLVDLLQQLHTHNPPVIHRDIKPSNIILKSRGGDAFDAYLIDFGAVANPQVQHGGSTVAGTYGYMPPEQLMGKPTPASDIYALGALAVNLITGIAPGDMAVKDFHLVFEPHMQNMPQAVQQTLRSMLEPNVENRLCNYDELRKRFKSFKKNDYKLDLKNFAPISFLNKQRLNTLLEDVEGISVAGNIEIWQRLPEETPRELPACLNPILIHPEKLSTNQLFSERSEEANKPTGKLFSILCTAVLMIAIVWFCFYYSVIAGIISLVVCSAIGGGVFAMKKMGGKKTAGTLPSESEDAATSPMTKASNSIQELVKNGCKAIATVIAVEYVPTRPEKVEVLLQDRNLVQCGYHGIPTFKVRYKFNPPDDSNPNDLIHEVIIHQDPKRTCQIGDPIPVLYHIKYENPKQELVESIPFPFPLNDLQDPSEMLGHSITEL